MATRGRPRAAAAVKGPAKLNKRLVLNAWMLKLFEASSTDALLDLFKDAEAEGIGEDGITHFHRRLAGHLGRAELPNDLLLGYDENIVRHWRAITGSPDRRSHTLKHFQYLALLFAEVYLDRYFRDRAALLDDLNAFVVEWNFLGGGRAASDQAEDFADDDLNKLAFWMATGSGKTLLMHVNIKQYQHYLAKAGKSRDLNRIILLTPNEGLSNQHLAELEASGMDAALFAKDGRTLFSGQAVEIIDIHKLAEDAREKTVAVDSFEGNNLVLVDEGHRGSSNSEIGVWMERRARLCEHGFSFEYSATFGQAITPDKKKLIQEYGHCILFDYSYRYFHADGYGKEFHILNLADDKDAGQRLLYLTGCVLAYLQQLRVFRDGATAFGPYGIEKPLWIFVGGSVTKTTSTKDVSDIVDILRFLDGFVRDGAATRARIDTLRGGSPGLKDGHGREVFANRFTALFKDRAAEDVYREALELIFNAPTGGSLHIEQIKAAGADGEIELRVGGNEPFGVVNVGDAAKVVTLCREQRLDTGDGRDFGGSLFRKINERDSTVNVLIGAKKFSEGWSSWRVSTMGLMNVGKSEGSEIIQLFGRGVRLKGYDFSLKRSAHVVRDDGESHPGALPTVETLNVFGVRADYMQQFKDFLEEEGLPATDDLEEIKLRVINRLEPGGDFDGVRLLTLKLQAGKDFKRDGPRPVLDGDVPTQIMRSPISLDWYPRIQSRSSDGTRAPDGTGLAKDERALLADHLAFLDFDALWLELERFKAEKAWHNMAIPREAARGLLARNDWYTLFIPAEEMDFTSFARVRLWHAIALALLKKYAERYYKFRQAEWEKDFLEYRELKPDDGNFFAEYTFQVHEAETDLKTELFALQAEIAHGAPLDHQRATFTALTFDRHLNVPLVHLDSSASTVTPVALNKGERDFVRHLRGYHAANPQAFAGKDLYVLRNRSRGKGLGFFEAGNFYPDFIIWLIDGVKTHLTFVDPKGLRNLQGKHDPKVEFAKRVKEHQARLGDPNVVLDSFLVSQTPYKDVAWWGGDTRLSQQDLEQAHILFPGDDPQKMIGRMFELMAG